MTNRDSSGHFPGCSGGYGCELTRCNFLGARDRHLSLVRAADTAACKFWRKLLGAFAWNLYDAGQQAWRKDVPRP